MLLLPRMVSILMGRPDAGLGSCAAVHAETCWEPRYSHWLGLPRDPDSSRCYFDVTPAGPGRILLSSTSARAAGWIRVADLAIIPFVVAKLVRISLMRGNIVRMVIACTLVPVGFLFCHLDATIVHDRQDAGFAIPGNASITSIGDGFCGRQCSLPLGGVFGLIIVAVSLALRYSSSLYPGLGAC